MKIAIDLRSLSSGNISGVENYCLNLVEHLLLLDKKNQYTLFYNSWQEHEAPEFHYVNSEIKKTRQPNKILNFSLKANLTSIEKLIGKFDLFFMPNLNQYNISNSAKLALTVHDLSPVVLPEAYNLKRRLWHRFLNYQKAFNRANIIFAVSEYTKNDLTRLFKLPQSKIKVIYPGIDHNKFYPSISIEKQREVRNAYGLPGDFILFLNTIEPRKNLSTLIRAFEMLKYDCFLVIAGKLGWKYKEIIAEISKSKKFDKIKYIGYVEEADKPALIKLAKVLVYPSIYEGFGFQPVEAMAVGTPAIVSNVTALPEVVGNGALLVDPYNTLELARSLDLILTDEQLRRVMIEKGQNRASQFDWNKTAGEILTQLQKVI